MIRHGILDSSRSRRKIATYPTTDLVGRWNFEDNLESTPNNYTLTPRGTLNTDWSYSSSGKIGKGFANAWDWDGGTEQKVVSQIYSLGSARTAMTIALWFKCLDATTDMQYLFAWYESNAKLFMGLAGSSFVPPGGQQGCLFGTKAELISNVDYRDSAWHHYAYVCDETYSIYYVDADLKATIGRDSNATTNAFYFANATGSWPIDGVADLLYIYNRALSGTEISQLYNGGDGI